MPLVPLPKIPNLSLEQAVMLTVRAAQQAMHALGPAQRESAYETAMAKTLYYQNVPLLTQCATRKRAGPGNSTSTGPADMFIAGTLLVELKAGKPRIAQEHIDQVMRYHASICEEHREVRDNEIMAMVINFKRTGDVVQLWNNKQQKITSLHIDRESSDPFALKRAPILESISFEEREV